MSLEKIQDEDRDETVYASLGIDPGWKNLGWALVYPTDSWKVEILECGTLNPSSFADAEIPKRLFVEFKKWQSLLEEKNFELGNVQIERYVSYGNVRSSETENITRVIGMLEYGFFHNWGEATKQTLLRAIDWKVNLVKHLSKQHGFVNDSPKSQLDKKFSMACAKFITTNPEKIKNDHMADAVCLAALPLLSNAANRVKNKVSTDSGEISRSVGKTV